MWTPRGFSFAGLNCGIKAVRKDVALIVSEAPCVAAGCFTVNKAKAAAVRDAEARLPGRGIFALIANSGNANALTGPRGDADVKAIQAEYAALLGVPATSVLSASTGVIGVPLPVKKVIDVAPRLKAALSSSVEAAAEAIFTTDTRLKVTSRLITIGSTNVHLSAFAKGSGMVAPQLATVLVFITTDAAISPSALQAVLDRAVRGSFNNLIIDGDMSPNDSVFALANGLAGNVVLDEDVEGFAEFEAALTDTCVELARAIAEDGEGATKAIEVRIEGAPDEDIGRDLARSVAGSSMVKAAVFGADPNWGRVLATIGARAGSQGFPVDPLAATVCIQGITVFEHGAPVPYDPASLKAKMRNPQIAIAITLAEGKARATAWGCDLSYDYVKINADYTSLITSSPEGTVTRDDRLTNYSPGFKRALLVEALSYIARFAGKRAVVKCGGASLVKDSLKASFAADINLLDAAGLLPVVVHGGEPEIVKTLEKLGGARPEYLDGRRVTHEEDLDIVEMVLSGRINTELVTLLNHHAMSERGAHVARAVGMSGKDGGLFRACKLRSEDGRDLGRMGEIVAVNADLLELLLGKEYVPVLSPLGLGNDGEGYHLNADWVAAEVAIALHAEKLIYLTDHPGILEHGELISEMNAEQLRQKIAAGIVHGSMLIKAQAVLKALAHGVRSAHFVDGRVPHGVVAELFTDHGVGTLVTP